MLRVIFEAVYVDVLVLKLVCVKPSPPFVPLFTMDGLEEREDGSFYCEEDGEGGSEGSATATVDSRIEAGVSADHVQWNRNSSASPGELKQACVLQGTVIE